MKPRPKASLLQEGEALQNIPPERQYLGDLSDSKVPHGAPPKAKKGAWWICSFSEIRAFFNNGRLLLFLLATPRYPKLYQFKWFMKLGIDFYGMIYAMPASIVDNGEWFIIVDRPFTRLCTLQHLHIKRHDIWLLTISHTVLNPKIWGWSTSKHIFWKKCPTQESNVSHDPGQLKIQNQSKILHSPGKTKR